MEPLRIRPLTADEVAAIAAEQRAYSWQECQECGGVFMVWNDPATPPIHEMSDATVQADWFCYRDGSIPSNGQIIHCSDCGSTDYASLHPRQRRYGPRLPQAPPLPF